MGIIFSYWQGATTPSSSSDSVTNSSEEINDANTVRYCEHCERDLGSITKAEGFCEDCLEYMCATCIRFHKRYQSSHKLKYDKSMPEVFCSSKCLYHSENIVKFYCKICEETACIICKNTNHINCIDVKYIPYYLTEDTEKFQSDLTSLGKKTNLLTDLLVDAELIMKTSLEEFSANKYDTLLAVVSQKDKLKRNIKDQRRQIIADLDETTNKLLEALETTAENMRTELDIKQTQQQSLEKKIILAEHQLDDVERRLSKLVSNGKHYKILITLAKTKHQVDNLQNDTTNLIEKSRTKTWYSFETDNQSFALPVLAETREKTVHLGRLKRRSEKPSAVFIHTIHLSSCSFPNKDSRSKEQCSNIIHGMCKLSDCRLVVVRSDFVYLIDIGEVKKQLHKYGTNKYKLLDVKQMLVSGITKIGDNEISVTNPEDKKILFLTVQEDSLVVTKQFSTDKSFKHIAYLNTKNNLVASSPTDMQILTIDGVVLTTAKWDSINDYGPFMIYFPEFVVKSNNSEILHITNKFLNTVGNYDLEGREQSMSKPFTDDIMSLATDKRGTVYVGTCHHSLAETLANKPHQWKPMHSDDNEKMCIYRLSSDLSVTEKIISGVLPQHMLFCDTEKKLYVGWGSIIYVYKIYKLSGT